MKSFKAWLFSTISILFLIGCTIEPSAEIIVEGIQNGFWLSSDASVETIRFDSACDWTASVDVPWITLSSNSGKSGQGIILKMSVNENDPVSGARDGVVSITSKQVTERIAVHQIQKDAISLEQDSYSIPASGGPLSIRIDHNVPVTIKVSGTAKDWIKYVGTKSMDSTIAYFEVSQNESYEGRVGYISVSNGAITKDITVTQGQKNDIIVAQKTFEVPAAGEDISIAVTSNVDYSVVVPDESKDWIKVVGTKAMKNSTICLSIAENHTQTDRSGFVMIAYGDIAEIVSISQPAGILKVEKEDYSVSSINEKILICVTHNISYKITIAPECSSWIKYLENESTSTNLVFDVAENATGESRKGTISITNSELICTVNVSQGKDALVIDADKYLVPAEGSGIEVKVDHDVEFTVDVDEAAQKWITQVSTRALVHSQLFFSVAMNDTDQPRTGKITLVGGDMKRVITINQDAAVLPSSITLSDTKLDIGVGSKKVIRATVAPDNATNKNVIWASTNPSVASVDAGVVKGLAPGTTTITATIGSLTASCDLTVLSESDLHLEQNVTVKLTGVGTLISDRIYYSRTYTITNRSIVDIELISIAASNSQGLSGTVAAGSSYDTTLYLNYNVTPAVTVKFRYNGKTYSIHTN